MPFKNGAFDEKPYNLLAQIQELVERVDVNDEVSLVWRAIQMHVLSVALYFPRLSQLETVRKGRAPKVDMIAPAGRHAAIKLYERYSFSKLRRSRPSS